MRGFRKLGRRGATLIEMTTAIFVLSVGVTGTVVFYHFQMDRARTLQEHTVAQAALTSEIEALRAAPFDTLAIGQALPFRSQAHLAPLLHRAETWVDVAPAEGTAPGLVEISATVQWVGERGRVMTRTLHTLQARLD